MEKKRPGRDKATTLSTETSKVKNIIKKEKEDRDDTSNIYK
jgi:hypothetical protein